MEYPLSEGPRRVQIQTQTGCNGRCVFCPNGAVSKAHLPMGQMPVALFRQIIDDLATTSVQRIMPYLQNEPLLDQRMPELVAYVSERLPHCTTLITSNGVKLSEAMGEALIDARLKRLKVSLQSLKDETNTRIMGYPAGPVIENILRFHKQIKAKRSKLDLRVSMVVHTHNHAEIGAAKHFWRRHGIRLVTSAIENRGGNIADAEALNLGHAMVRCGNCIRPSREMCVLYNGRVVVCCVDWFRTTDAGDLKTARVREIWNNAYYQRIRQGLRENNNELLPEICINCTESACPNEHRPIKGGWDQFKKSFLGPFMGEAH